MTPHLCLAFLVLFALLIGRVPADDAGGGTGGVCVPAVGGDVHGTATVAAVALSVLVGMIFIAHRKNLVDEFAQLGRATPCPTRKPNSYGITSWNVSPLVFKIAAEDWEFDLIHQLNYRTFVEEIPQHEVSATKRMVDKFHAENTVHHLPERAAAGGDAGVAGEACRFRWTRN